MNAPFTDLKSPDTARRSPCAVRGVGGRQEATNGGSTERNSSAPSVTRFLPLRYFDKDERLICRTSILDGRDGSRARARSPGEARSFVDFFVSFG